MVTFDSGVNGLLGHGSVGGPLATGYRDEVRGADVDDVVTRQRLGIGFVGIGHQGSDTAPGRQDVASPNLNVRVQVVLHLLQDEHDLVFGGLGIVRHLARQICRTGDSVLLPGQEEDDAAVARGWIEKTHLIGTVNEI